MGGPDTLEDLLGGEGTGKTLGVLEAVEESIRVLDKEPEVTGGTEEGTLSRSSDEAAETGS